MFTVSDRPVGPRKKQPQHYTWHYDWMASDIQNATQCIPSFPTDRMSADVPNLSTSSNKTDSVDPVVDRHAWKRLHRDHATAARVISHRERLQLGN